MGTERVNPKAAKILVVDDEPELTEIIKDFLEGSGYTVKIENIPSQAIQTAKTFKPDFCS